MFANSSKQCKMKTRRVKQGNSQFQQKVAQVKLPLISDTLLHNALLSLNVKRCEIIQIQ